MFRSGTTLLSRMVNAHGKLSIAYDTFLPLFQSLRMTIASKLGVEFGGHYGEEAKYFYPVNDYYFCDAEVMLFKQIMSTDMCHSISDRELDTIRRMIQAYGERFEPTLSRNANTLEGSTYSDLFVSIISLISKSKRDDAIFYGFKEAWADEFIPALINTFPDIKILQIIRDPRAVCASKNYSIRTKPYPLLFITRRWRKHAMLYSHFQNRFPGNLLAIKYEELIASPEVIANQLCEFLEVEFDNAMLDTGKYINGEGAQWAQNSSYIPVGTGINSESLCRWMHVLTKSEIEFIEKMCFPEMIATGYQFHFLCDATSTMEPPVFSIQVLSEWIRSYFPITLDDTVAESQKEIECNKLLLSGKKCDTISLERCFLSEDYFDSLYKKHIHTSPMRNSIKETETCRL